MLRKQSVRTLTLAAWAVVACTLPENNPPAPATGGGAGMPQGGTTTGGTTTGGTTTGGTTTGGTTTGGTTTGGTATGGTTTGGTTTGGTATGGTGGSGTGGSMAGTATGGTMAGGGGKGGTAGTAPTGGTAGSSAGQGGTMGGAGSAGTAGTTGGGGSTSGILTHRYSFSGTDTTATDSVGTAHGTIIGGTQAGGQVTLAGGTTDQYVSLPAGLLDNLDSATFEAWVTWTGAAGDWPRIFDFGENDALGTNGQGTTNTTSSYIFLTPRSGGTNAPIRAAFTLTGPAATAEIRVTGTASLPTTPAHVAVVFDSPGGMMYLYQNGVSIGTPIAWVGPVSSVNDLNNWLGRSQFQADAEFAGTISEFRIYRTARTGSQIAASNTAGPDSPPTQ